MQKKSLFLITLMIICLINLKVSENIARENAQTSSAVGPISINGTSQLIPYTTSGNGTSTNPYYIKDLSIDCGAYSTFGSNPVGLYITNVNSYFVLSNITVTDYCYYGIQLAYDGQGEIINSYVTTANFGINILSSPNTIIQNNTLDGNLDGGLDLVYANYSLVTYNIVNNTLSSPAIGIDIVGSYYDNVSSNIVMHTGYRGYDLQLSKSTVRNNTAMTSHTGFVIASDNTLFINNKAMNQAVGFEIDNGNNGAHNLLLNNTAVFNSNGFYVYNSVYNNYEKNNASYNSNDGILIYIAYNDNFTNNTVTHNKANGFELVGSSYNTIAYNTVTNNTINLNQDTSNSNNTIYGNSFNETSVGSSGTSGPTKATTSTSSTNTTQILQTSSKPKTTKNLPVMEVGIFLGSLIVFMVYKRKKLLR